MFSFKIFSFAIASLIFVAACNQQTETNTKTTTSTTTESVDTSVINGVSSKGPISSALIEIYAFNANDGNESGTPIVSTTTDTNGKWSVSIPSTNRTAALLIKSSGGSYLDESDPEPNPSKKRVITFGANDSILGALFPGFNTASVTMMTGALIEKSRIEANGANFLSVLNNNRNISTSALGFDPFTVASANPLAPSTAADDDSIEYAMYLGGMATALNSAAILMGKPVPDFAIIEGFIHDMADGRLNGSNQSGPVSVMVNGTPTLFPTTLDLNQATTRFRNNNFAAYSVTPVVSIVTVNETMLATSGVNSNPNALDDAVTTIENTAVVTPNLLSNDTDPDGNTITISGANQPVNGQITNNNDGTFTYTPNNGFAGSDIFSYMIDDGHGGNDSAQVIVTVNATNTNTDPIAVDDVASTNQGTAVTTPDLLINDSDADGDTLTISNFSQPDNGTAVNNNDGTFAYTPDTGFSGGDSFNYTISDGNNGIDTALVNITVIRINISPVAVDDNLTTNQDTPATTANLLANDTDADGNTLTITNFSQPTGGQVTSNNDGTFNYTPNAGFSGSDSFNYIINDGNSGTDTATVTITVNSTNSDPIATNDSLITNQDTPATTTNLLANDNDPDGNPLTISAVTQPANGAIANNNNGTIIYTPTTGFSGADSFTYTISDGLGGTATATVNVTVNSTNSNPVAVNDSLVTNQDTPATTTDLLANDSDPDSNPLTISNFSQAANGFVANNNDGTFNYTPSNGFSGNDSFTYTINDGFGGMAIATVNITVTSTNSNPIALDDSLVTNQDRSATTINLLTNDSDPDNDLLSISNFSQPANGLVTNNGDGTFTYTPTTGFSGGDSFSYSITDGNGGTDSALVTITVTGSVTNTPPTATAGIDQTVNELSAVTLTGTGADSDGTIASYQWSQVGGTTVTINNANTNTANLTSPEVLVGNIDVLVFQLTVTDNSGGVGVDFVTIIVNPVAIAPTANAGPDQTVSEQTLVTLNGGVSTDDTVIDIYAWSQLTPASPQVVLSNPAAISPTFIGPDVANDTTFTFQLTVTDNEGGTASDTVAINLTSDNTGPTGIDDTGSTPEDIPITITNLLANDTDISGNNTPFSISGVTQSANGMVVIEANGTDVTYTPDLNFNGTDTFTYTSQDSLGANSVNAATVTVTVSGLNDNPVANPDTGSTIQGFPVTLSNLTANDTDPENDPLSISGIPSQPANGSVVNNIDGTITYTPFLTFSGDDSFTYSVVDGTGGSATGIVTITVTPDTDGDGVIDSQEAIDGTDPDLADTDGDGFFDGHEKLVNTNAINGINVFPPTTTISSVNSNNVISVDTLWSLANAPYWVQSDVSIQSGATLTIEPGVVVKSNAGVDFFVNAGGTLDAIGNAAIPQHVVFTSALDDQINGDTNGDGVSTTQSDYDWNGIDYQAGSTGTLKYAAVKYGYTCLGIYNSSPIISNIEVGDCGYHGVEFQSTSSTRTANLSNITVNDYDGNGYSTIYHGIYIYSASASIATLNVDNLTITEAGNNASDYGLYIYANGGTINGSVDNVNVTNSFNDGINILNNGANPINLALSNLTVNGSGANSLDVRQNSTGLVTTSFDGINSFTNNNSAASNVYFLNNDPDFLITGNTTIWGGAYNLALNNSNGNFNNFSLASPTYAGLHLNGASAPAVFNNVVLTNAPSPYELAGYSITATITAGYDFSATSVIKTHARVQGTLGANLTLGADPLNTGSSVWRATADITIPTGVTLTINDGAIVKFDAGFDISVTGSLVIGDLVPDGAGSNAILTSIKDDSVGGDTLGDAGNDPAANNWGYINALAGSSINIDNAIIRYMNRGIYQANVAINSLTVTNSSITDFYDYGLDIISTGDATYTLDTVDISNGGINDGLRISNYLYMGAPITLTLNFDNVTIDTIGNTNVDRGLEIYFNSYYGHTVGLTGRIDNLTVNNTAGDNVLIQNTTAGVVDVVLSGLTLSNPNNSRYGLYLAGIGDGNFDITIDDSFAIGTTNLIGNANAGSGGVYGLLLSGVAGTYSNITINNTTTTSLHISGGSDPTAWEDATINISNSPSPWSIHTAFPASIGFLGTSDLGYTVGSGITMTYLKVNGTLANTTLFADPLNTFGTTGVNSVWRVPSDIIIPAGVTLTINDGAIVKFDAGFDISVTGSLVIGDLVPDGAGSNAILTSIKDDSVGGDTLGDAGNDPAANNWGYINALAGSSINIDNAIIRYMNRGIYQANVAINSLTVTNSSFTDFYDYGLDLITTGDAIYTLDTVNISNGGINDGLRISNYIYMGVPITVTLDFDNVTIDTIGNTNVDRGLEIYFDSYYGHTVGLGGRIDNLTVNNTAGDNVLMQNKTAGLVGVVLSGLTLSNPNNNRYGLYLIGLGDGNFDITIDDSAFGGPTNLIGNASPGSGGVYGLLLSGVTGTYSNITINNTTTTSFHISAGSDPIAWEDATINISNSPSPWSIHTAFPASIGVLGTADLGYTAGSGLTTTYVKVNGTLADTTLVADPLNTGSSVWRVFSDIAIPAGVTLNIDDGAIVKFDAGFDINVTGSLVIGDLIPDGVGPNAILTSIKDDNVGGDTLADAGNDAAANNWGYINALAGSSINIDNAIIRYMNRGIYQANVAINSLTVTNSSITDFYDYGLDIITTGDATYTLDTVDISNGTNNDGLHITNYLYMGASITLTLDFDNVTIDTIGNSSGDRGLDIYFNSQYGHAVGLTGRIDNLTVNNTAGDNVLIQNNTAGVVDVVLSGLTLSNPNNSRYGLYLIGIGDGNFDITIDDSALGGPTNLIGNASPGSGGVYGLLLSGVTGTYSNITINNTTTAALYLANNSNPLLFDSTSINFLNSPSPYYLVGMGVPSAVSYTSGAGLVEDYIRFSGTLLSDMTFTADPLGDGSGTSVWYLPADLIVPSGITLTIPENAVVKAGDGVDVFIDGTMNVTAGLGTEAIFTDIKDDSVNGDTLNDGITIGTLPVSNSATNNWQGIDFRINSLGAVDNLIVNYADNAVSVQNAGGLGGLDFTNLTINNSVDGLYVYQSSASVGTAPTFNGLSINECSSQHLYLRAENNTVNTLFAATFSGSLSITDTTGTSGSDDGIYASYIGSATILSGFTITGTDDGIDTQYSTATFSNNLIREARSKGVHVRLSSSPVFKNNTIVDNGGTAANDSGIYVDDVNSAPYILNNVIRHNSGRYGAGIMLRGPAIVQNNLIVENEDNYVDVYGGGGIHVASNIAPSILNNTIANNTSVTTTQGAGLAIQGVNITATILDNIIYGNTDGNSTANDVYFDSGSGSILTENFNLIGTHNLASVGANTDEGVDPLFTDGWYLTVDALNGGGSDSPAIDVGSDLAGNTALGNGTVVLSATTTRTDGADETAGSLVDKGYHYPSGSVAPVISPANSTATPTTTTINPNGSGGTVITITITPKDASDQIIGSGLKVVATADVNNMSGVTDHGDGTYSMTYTTPTGSSSDTVTFTANSIAITASASITWIQ